MSNAEHAETPPPPPARRGLSPLWLVLFVVGLVLVPYLFWRGTWFGRRLTDAEIAEYLGKTDKPRHVQHALSQIADGIVRGEPAVKQWYPRVLALAASPVPEVRVTAAWVMGQDNRSEAFHRALAELLSDPNPMVQRNAALSLVRFADARGRPVLVMMLRPYTVPAPLAGVFSPRLKEDDTVDVGTLLGRISAGEVEPAEVRSPVSGRVNKLLRQKGAQVAQGEPIYELDPSPEQVWEALRGLYLVGTADDLPDVERFISPARRIPGPVRQQAQLAAQAIRNRASAPAPDPALPGQPAARSEPLVQSP